MYALIDQDEEIDSGAYAAYLRAQSDADLLDIFLHLDPERYPARVDAARRETLRRQVVPLTIHTAEERFVRGLVVCVLGLSGVILLLVILLAPADLDGPVWPTDEMFQNGTAVSAVMRLVLLGILRSVVVYGDHIALIPLLTLGLAGWSLRNARRRSIRSDVKRLAVWGLVALCAALSIAALPGSTVPLLLDPSAQDQGFWARVLIQIRPA